MLNKHKALQDTIEVNKGKRICLVIPERGNKDKTENFWKNELKDKNIQLSTKQSNRP